jgi:hypothetical protein
MIRIKTDKVDEIKDMLDSKFTVVFWKKEDVGTESSFISNVQNFEASYPTWNTIVVDYNSTSNTDKVYFDIMMDGKRVVYSEDLVTEFIELPLIANNAEARIFNVEVAQSK